MPLQKHQQQMDEPPLDVCTHWSGDCLCIEGLMAWWSAGIEERDAMPLGQMNEQQLRTGRLGLHNPCSLKVE